MLVRDLLDLPANATPDEFIVRPQSDAADLARKYTLTSAIAPRMGGLLDDIRGAIERNEDIGRFIFGSFGSGKSHFLRIAGMMLANDERLYDNARDGRLRELRNTHPWLEKTKILVVPVSMVGADAEVGSFTRSLATEFDRTLADLGQPTLNAFGTIGAFEAFDRQCSATPEIFAAFSSQTGYDRPFYDDVRLKASANIPTRSEGESKEIIAFARVVGRFLTGSEHAFEPTEGEAREQMARHAHALGYHAVAFTIDEFILWAQGLRVEGYAAAVNALNALVESADVKPVRFIVLAAIQRSIMTVFPEDRSDKPLREQLARVKDRFPELPLEDSNIFEIAENRVLTPRPERAVEWRAAVAAAAQRFGSSEQSVLVGEEPAAALAQLYPFHPALLRVLSDVSQGLQRARSSLYMLYQLITEIRPNLEIGQLVSLGALWDVLFAEAHLSQLMTYGPKNEPNHTANRLLKTYATFERLKPAIDAATKASADERVLLDVTVQSALLAQLSHTPFLDANRGLDAAITVENLFRLNRADIKAINETSGIIKVERLLLALAQSEPGVVMLEGTGASARLRIELDAIDLTELLESLRPGPLFGTLLTQLKLALNLTSIGGQEGRLSADWRHTPRNGHVRFESFEQFTVSGKNSTLALESGDEFKLGILLESEFTTSPQAALDNARATLESTRDQSQSWAAAWLPAPLAQEAKDALVLLAKIELFEAKQDDYLGKFRAGEHALVRQRMGTMKVQNQTTLATGITRAYQAGRVITLRKDPGELIAPGNVDLAALPKFFASRLLDRRYQQHPRFGASPGQAQLNALVALDRRLAADATKNVITGDDLDIVKKIGEPLDIFEPGSGVTNAKHGLYLDRIGEYIVAGDRRVSILIERLAREPYGIGRQVAQALICVYISRLGYRATLDGIPIKIETIGDLDPRAELAKGDLPSLDQWNAAREVASLVFAVADVPNARTVGNADDLALKLVEPIARLRDALDRCCNAFAVLRKEDALNVKSMLADRYAKARLEVAALIDRADVIVQVGQLNLDRFKTIASSAEVDGTQLERLAHFEHLSTVLSASVSLREKLAKTLTVDVTSVAPDVDRWIVLAKTWIDQQLKSSIAVPAPLSPEPVKPDNLIVAPSVRIDGAAGRSWRRTVTLPLTDEQIAPIVDDLRVFLRDAGEGESVVIEAYMPSIDGVER